MINGDLMESISFGVGCFNFNVNKNPPFKFKGSTYQNDLKKFLDLIPGISNISIDFGNMENFHVNDSLEKPELQGGLGVFPYIDFGFISFDLLIPFENQKELIKTSFNEREYVFTYTEKFRVHIEYDYYLPIAYIIPLKPEKTTDTAQAVRIVREFLLDESKKLDDYIKFEVLGPSPFHADFKFKPVEKNKEKFWLFDMEIQKSKGYDEISIEYNILMIDDIWEAFSVFHYYVNSEFGLYYIFIQDKNVINKKWIGITNLVDEITEIQNQKLIKFLKNPFKYSNLLKETYLTITKFESYELSTKNRQKNELKELLSNEENYLGHYIKKEMGKKGEYPSKQIFSLIEFLENRRSKTTQMYVVLAASLIGGIIGSIMTMIANSFKPV